LTDQRTADRTAFLKGTDWENHSVTYLAGDASNRKYYRLVDSDGSTDVLMDSPGDPSLALTPFIHLTKYLTQAGLAPPQIKLQNTKLGFLVLEDLGDAVFARHLEAKPKDEHALYQAAVDVLIHLHKQAVPDDIGSYDSKRMGALADLARTWYGAGCDHPTETPLNAEIETVLCESWGADTVFVQRDFHAENLLWLPNRQSPKNVGLLDYQDGLLGHPAYDLVSLLEDARRDVTPQIQTEMLDHYIHKTNHDPEAFKYAYATQGAQRNLRILGVFARLSMHFGKTHYVDLIPRVWDHLQTDLSHSALTSLRTLCAEVLPEPTPENLQKLKDKCATIPHL